MKDREILQEVQADLQATPAGVIYLEGKTDVAPFFGLLGVPHLPGLDDHRGVGVRGLNVKRGSGGGSVKRYVGVAREHGLGRAWGIIDGDGADLATLGAAFDPPYDGPIYTWKAYCIENLLAKVGWPSHWPRIDMQSLVLSYAPYVALNLLYRKHSALIATVGLNRFHRPIPHEPLKKANDVLAALQADQSRLSAFDIALNFQKELSAYDQSIALGPDHYHAMLNGKWLIEHAAVEAHQTHRSADQCREEWAADAAARGGLLEVRALWQRLTGAPP